MGHPSTSASVVKFPIIVPLVGFCNPQRDPHFNVFLWNREHLVLEQVNCGGPVGEVLSLEEAEDLHNALGAAIEAIRCNHASTEPLILTDDKGGKDWHNLGEQTEESA